MSLGAARRDPSRTRRRRIAAARSASIDPARSTATTHGNPRSASRPPVGVGATPRAGLGADAAVDQRVAEIAPGRLQWLDGTWRDHTRGHIRRRDRCAGRRSIGSLACGSATFRTSHTYGAWSMDNDRTYRRSARRCHAGGDDAAAAVSTGTAISGAATVAGAGASDTSTGGVVSDGGVSATGAGAGSGGGAGWAGGAGCGAGGGTRRRLR